MTSKRVLSVTTRSIPSRINSVRKLLVLLAVCCAGYARIAGGSYFDAVFVDSNGLYGIDLSSGDIMLLVSLPGHPEGVTVVDESKFIISKMSQNSEVPDLILYDSTSGKTKNLGTGSNPLFFIDRNELVFYDTAPSGYGLSLYVSKLDSNNQLTQRRALLDGPFTSGNTPLVYSDRTILVVDSSNNSILIDLHTLESIELHEFSDCIPILMVEQNVLCSYRKNAFRLVAPPSPCNSEGFSFPGIPILYNSRTGELVSLGNGGDALNPYTMKLVSYNINSRALTRIDTETIFSRSNSTIVPRM